MPLLSAELTNIPLLAGLLPLKAVRLEDGPLLSLEEFIT